LTALDDEVERLSKGRARNAVLVVAIVASLVIGATAGVLLLRPEQTPTDTSPEAGFARDMSVHHSQAVEMAFAVYPATGDPEIRQLAYDIINTQRTQIGMFSGWLQQWDLAQTSTASPMAWVGQGHDGLMTDGPMMSYEDMPGMATDEQMDKLRNLTGAAAELMFLELMIEHHRGGVAMAEAIIPLTDREEVQRIATTIVNGQQAEISNMEVLLANRTPAPGQP